MGTFIVSLLRDGSLDMMLRDSKKRDRDYGDVQELIEDRGTAIASAEQEPSPEAKRRRAGPKCSQR